MNIQIVESAKDTADYVPDTAIVWYVKYSLNELRGTLSALSDASRTNPALSAQMMSPAFILTKN